MNLCTHRNAFGQIFLVDLGPRIEPDREAWAAFNALRANPACLVDTVFTPVLTPGAPASPLDHRFGEVVLNEDPAPATLSHVRRAFSNVRGARLHI